MKVGDKIRLFTYTWGHETGTKDFIVEEFRHCLGIFASEEHRLSGDFTPLCTLYENGPESEKKYIPNYGEYYTNQVQAWMDIPKDPEA